MNQSCRNTENSGTDCKEHCLTAEERIKINRLLHHWVVPAIGCTEPICVALAVSRATELLGSIPARIEARLSANILKNAMGVGIPGTGMVGLPIAIALGALVGRSEYGLEVLRDSNAEALERGKAYINENRIQVELKPDAPEKLYVEVVCHDDEDHQSQVVIAREHTHYIYIAKDGEVVLDLRNELQHANEGEDGGEEDTSLQLNLRKVFEYATTAPIEEIEFINEAKRLNEAAARRSLEGNYGHNLGKALTRPLGKGIMGESIFSHILSSTSSACDARMAGAMIPVMSNSGSGNQGITATLPVVVYGEECGASREQMIRALTLSHLTVIYIKQSLGRLSALCGCVVAASGSSCGITYLMGGGYDEVSMAVKNMIANITGMICDGAKPSCAMKLASGVSTAVLSAMLAMEHRCVSELEGIVDRDVDRTIHNLTSIGRDGMNETDRLILDIMTSKC